MVHILKCQILFLHSTQQFSPVHQTSVSYAKQTLVARRTHVSYTIHIWPYIEMASPRHAGHV